MMQGYALMTAPPSHHGHGSTVTAERRGGQPPSPEPRVRRKDAARYLTDIWGVPMSPKTLAKLAVTGGGPHYRKAGRFPLYEITALDEFARTKLSPLVSSTSELEALGRKDSAEAWLAALPDSKSEPEVRDHRVKS
jgi:hypothetical protein